MTKTLTAPVKEREELAPLRTALPPFWEPFSHFESLLGMPFGRLFEDAWRPWAPIDRLVAAPLLDLTEDDDNVWIDIELPGLAREDVNLQIQDDVLTISGERKAEQEEKKRHYRRVERRFGRFSRSLSLPYGVQADKIEAQMKDGILKIRLPKSAEAKTRTIAIK